MDASVFATSSGSVCLDSSEAGPALCGAAARALYATKPAPPSPVSPSSARAIAITVIATLSLAGGDDGGLEGVLMEGGGGEGGGDGGGSVNCVDVSVALLTLETVMLSASDRDVVF